MAASWAADIVAAVSAAASAALRLGRPKPAWPPHTILTSNAAHANAIAASWVALMKLGRVHRAIGFDVEFVKHSSCRAALLQMSVLEIASGVTHTMCVRLCQLDHAPPALLLLLSDPHVPKAGVAVGEDLKRVEAFVAASSAEAHFVTAGGLELVPLARRAGYSSKGLASLALEVLGETLEKASAVRCSDWEAKELSAAQVRYAAADASVSLRLLLRLQKAQGDAPPLRSEAAIRTSIGHRYNGRSGSGGGSRGGGGESSSGGSGKASARHKKAAVPGRKRPMYDGWLMLDPQGLPM